MPVSSPFNPGSSQTVANLFSSNYTIWDIVVSAWVWDPSVILGCALLLFGYVLAVPRPRSVRRALLFTAGVATLFVALESPLDPLGDTYLFSAHMVQHLLLVLVVPPLLLLGIPAELAERIRALPYAGGVERVLGHPAVAWLVGIGFVWIWHVPALYNAALADEQLHILEHLCFLVTSTMFWWPILAQPAATRLSPPLALPYLMAAGIANTLLGILLAYAPVGLYPAYLHPVDWLGILPLIRDGWHLSPEADQQLGGLLMWVPGGLVYLVAMLGVFVRWYSQPEEDVPKELIASS